MSKKTINTSLWLAAVIVVCLCIIYSLGFISIGNTGQGNTGQAVNKEYAAGGLSYTYSGSMLNGKFSGAGEMYFSDGSSYTGEFINGLFDGSGVFTSADGWQYEGTFSEGKMTGEGRLTHTDGTVTAGFWLIGEQAAWDREWVTAHE